MCKDGCIISYGEGIVDVEEGYELMGMEIIGDNRTYVLGKFVWIYEDGEDGEDRGNRGAT